MKLVNYKEILANIPCSIPSYPKFLCDFREKVSTSSFGARKMYLDELRRSRVSDPRLLELGSSPPVFPESDSETQEVKKCHHGPPGGPHGPSSLRPDGNQHPVPVFAANHLG